MDRDTYYQNKPAFDPVGELNPHTPNDDAGPRPRSAWAVYFCRGPMVETQLMLTHSAATELIIEKRRAWAVEPHPQLVALKYRGEAIEVDPLPSPEIVARLRRRFQWRLRLTVLLATFKLAGLLPWNR